jgi:hypothetical protein
MLLDDYIKQQIPVENFTDEMIKKMGYAIEYSEFWGLSEEEFNYWQKTRKILLQRKKTLNENKLKKIDLPLESSKKALSGQLWEECKCGRSPIYMSHDCCEYCANKSTQNKG